MNDFISKIGAGRPNLLFISPHLDDVALSCAGLIFGLAGTKETCIITIFTDAGGHKPTLSAKRFLKLSGTNNARSHFDKRRNEDILATKYLGAKHAHLEFEDGSFRRKNAPKNWLARILPEFEHIYPTYRWHLIRSKVAESDQPLIRKVAKSIRDLNLIVKGSLIFAPWGFGGHADHLIAKKVAESLNCDLCYYSDIPYCFAPRYAKDLASGENGWLEFPVDYAKKDKLLRIYESQYEPLGLSPETLGKEYYKIET